MAFDDPCIVTCAISGAVTTKEQHPAIPYTPEEYGEQARAAREAGASVVHIHARTPEGHPTWEVEHYRAITEAIVDACPDIVVNYSTGAVGVDIETRLRFLRELHPEMGALNMGSMNYAKWSHSRGSFVFDFVFQNPFDEILALVECMHEEGILPEMECFDVGHVESIEPLVSKGWLPEPMQFSLILGVLGGIQADPANLVHMASRVPAGSNWEVIGISRDQWRLIATAAALGGNVRAGLEDNFYLSSGDAAAGNGQLIAEAVRIVEAQGRSVAEPNQARAILGLEVPARAR